MLTLCVHLRRCMSASLCRVLVMDHTDSLLTGLTLEDKSPVCWQAQSSAGTTAREGVTCCGHLALPSSMNAKNRKVCFHSGISIQKYYTNKNIYCSVRCLWRQHFIALLVSPQCLFQKVGYLGKAIPECIVIWFVFSTKKKTKLNWIEWKNI